MKRLALTEDEDATKNRGKGSANIECWSSSGLTVAGWIRSTNGFVDERPFL